MPVYSFICVCGKVDEIQRPMSASGKRLKCACGKLMRRNFGAEAPGRRAASDTYPHASYALGGHPDDRAKMTQDAINKNVPTEINRDGDPVFTSAGHRKKYCEAFGFYDRNAGYSDPKPKNLT